MSTIKLDDADSARYFAHGDHTGFDFVETVKDYDALYKDMCPATTIAKGVTTGKFYALNWESYESHYGSGKNEYPSLELYEVQQVEKVITTKEWVAV